MLVLCKFAIHKSFHLERKRPYSACSAVLQLAAIHDDSQRQPYFILSTRIKGDILFANSVEMYPHFLSNRKFS